MAGVGAIAPTAVTADPPGIDSIHFNPAGLVRIPHSISEIKMATFQQSNHAQTGEQRVDEQTRALYESLAQAPYPSDPLANQQGQTVDPVLLLPGGVAEEMELPVAVMGGVAIRPPQADMVFATAGYSPLMVGVTRELDLTMPLADADYYGIGIARHMADNTALEVSLGYLTSKYTVDYGQSNNANSEDPYNLLYSPYVFLSLASATRSVLLALSYTKPY